jgi:hypothetical protein
MTVFSASWWDVLLFGWIVMTRLEIYSLKKRMEPTK